MTTPFVDQSERDYRREQEAGERFEHLKLIRREVAGGEEADAEQVARLAVDFAETTDSTNYILARFAETEDRFPDFSKRVRCFIDAVIGATAGSAEFVEVADEEIAGRMGASEKTLQRAREELRAWPGHTKLIEIKEHWRDRDTLESHPHAYRCHVTQLAAETTLDARLSPRYGADDRSGAFRESARVTADSAKGFVARPAKRRKRKPEAAQLLSDVEAAVKKLKAASARQATARNVDFDRLAELRGQLSDALAEFDSAFGFDTPEPAEPPPVSTQYTDIKSMDTEEGAAPDAPPDGRRMDSPEEVDNLWVDKLSGLKTVHSDPSEADPPEDFDLSEWVWMKGGEVQYRFPPPNKSSPELERAIYAAIERLGGGGGVRDGTV